MDDLSLLLQNAEKASLKAYAPYSRFRVGAALKTASGAIYTGANIENRSFGLTVCAERTALFQAILNGEKDFLQIAIYCRDADYPVSPCGACRQVLSEFCDGNMEVIFSGSKGEAARTTLKDLFPFDALHDLKEKQD